MKLHNWHSVDRILISNQKFHCTEQNYDAKNDVASLTTFDGILENLRQVKCYQSKNFEMVCTTISLNGKLRLKFIDKELKLNAESYKQEILKTYLYSREDRLIPKRIVYFSKILHHRNDRKQHRYSSMSLARSLSNKKIGYFLH